MKISNLRLEHSVPFKYGKPQARIICDLDAKFTSVREFWFSVDENYYEWLTTDVYDAFLVALLYPAMYYGEDIEIEGSVSKKLYHNIMHYVQGIVAAYEVKAQKIAVKVGGFQNARKCSLLHVGTGFSGGVDSFSTLYDNYLNTNDEDYKVDTLFFFHVGQYGNTSNSKTWERANNRFGITKSMASELQMNSVMLNTNMFGFYLPHWEYDAGVLCRLSSVLVFQKVLKRYYISGTNSYKEFAMSNLLAHHVDMAEMSDPIIMPLLSPDGLDILCDGSQYSRTEKTKHIINWGMAQNNLNVCVNTSDSHTAAVNCGCCSKCLRTLMALDSAGALGKFANVFPIEKWKQHKLLYVSEQVVNYDRDSFAHDNVDFAISNGRNLPSKPVALIVVYANKTYWLIRHLGGFILRKLNIIK